MAKARLKRVHSEDDVVSSPVSKKHARLEKSQEEPEEEHRDEEDVESTMPDPDPKSAKRAKTGVARIRARQTQDSSQSTEPEIGIVECVELHDFMCHERAIVELRPKVNFVTGQNGSGKSAILTALVVALGGKATTTNRASSLKGFIRQGRTRATIKVKLRNRGPDAYQPDLYGGSIVIERQLNNTSASISQYRIRNGDTGEVVSKRKEDVIAITDHMAIQVDNPINILSQDAAREFLSSTSPDKMYQFFLKGTQLYQLSEDLETVRQAIARAEASIERKKEVLPEMRAEKKRWEQHYEDMRQARDISSRMTSLCHQMAWALVEEAEEDARQFDESIDIQKSKIAKVTESVQKEAEKITEIDGEAQALMADAESQLAHIAPLEEEKQGPMMAVSEIKASLRTLKENEVEINNEARATRERIEALKKDLATERSRLKDKDQAGKEKLKQTMAVLEDSIKEEEAKIAEHQEEQKACESRSRELSDTKGRCIRLLNTNQALVERTEKTLEDLQRQTSNRLNAYGRGVPEAIELIKKTAWQGMQPLGPVGEYIKLHDKKWSAVIETTLDKSLNSFLVEKHADRVALDHIFRKTGCNSRIIVCNTELFDYSPGEASSEYLTILRALEFSNEVVKRQLINLHRIEQVILVEQRALGDRIMTSNNGGYPQNVIACLTVDGFNVGSRKGGLSTQSIQMTRPTSRLGEDISQAIAKEEQRLAEQTRALREAKQELEKTEHEIKELSRKHERAGAEIRKCKSSINRYTCDIEKTRDLLFSNEPAKIAELENELETTTNQLESIQTQFRDHHAAREAKETERAQIEDDIKLIDRKIEAIRGKAEKLRQSAEAKAAKSQHHRDNIEYWNSKSTKMQEKLQSLEQKKQEMEAKVREAIADARQVCEERIEAEHPASKLDRMISDCRARLEEIERSSSMSLAEVSEKAQNHISSYNKAKEDLRTAMRLVSSLKAAHQTRLHTWTQFRDSMTLRTKLHFSDHLFQRGYTGKLDFDHSQRTLVPKVQTDQDLIIENAAKGNGKGSNGTGSFQRKDTKSLSGGEKSFTTICLLLSLWETMNCPVRALDEFDVFMDAANRAIAMSMMIESARSKNETQFILISPLDMNVKPDPDITIFRLQPPKRMNSGS